MDSYRLTNKMRQARRRYRFTATEQALYYELIAICNSEDWSDVFDCSNEELCVALSVHEKTLVKARVTLINAGLIYYKSGKSKRVVSQYSFTIPFKTTEKNTVDKSTDTPTKKPAKPPDSYKQKQNLMKEKEEKEIKIKGYDNIDFSFIEPDYVICFMDWLEYKRGKNQKYRTQKSIETCYKQLKEKAENDADTARKIIEKSIGNNWAGLFPIQKYGGQNNERHKFTGKIRGKKFEDF